MEVLISCSLSVEILSMFRQDNVMGWVESYLPPLD
jgi:hypothetical protein